MISVFCFRLAARRSGTSGVIRAHLLVLLQNNSGWEVQTVFISTRWWRFVKLIILQEIWIYLLAFAFCRVKGTLSNYWVHEAMQIQEVQIPGRQESFSLQIGAFHILPMGSLRQDQCWDWGTDLSKLLFGGRICWNPQCLSWILFYLPLGQAHFKLYKTSLHKLFLNNSPKISM